MISCIQVGSYTIFIRSSQALPLSEMLVFVGSTSIPEHFFTRFVGQHDYDPLPLQLPLVAQVLCSVLVD